MRPPPGLPRASDGISGGTFASMIGALALGHSVNVDVAGSGHVGYLATARMLGEAGLLLAEEGATPERAGCLTPSLALGTAAVGRFEQAGLRFNLSGAEER
jgi:short subunit dehydrogenase-like uncharacterized protein